MKLLSTLGIVLSLSTTAWAQVIPGSSSESLYDAYGTTNESDTKTVKETDYRPSSGQFSIGFDAVPVIDLALNTVNIMNDTGQQGTGLNSFVNGYDQTLYGKYYWTKDMAIRARVAFNVQSDSASINSDNPIDVNNGAESIGEVTTSTSSTTTNILLGGGVEWRHGGNQVQAFYGAEGLIGFGGQSTSTSYGWDFGQAAADAGVIQDGSRRSLGTTQGSSFSIGARGFAGVEFFLMEDVSLSAEFGWAIAYTSRGRQGETFEVWNVDADGNGSVGEEDEDISAGGSSFRMGVDNGIDAQLSGPTGAIVLSLHI